MLPDAPFTPVKRARRARRFHSEFSKLALVRSCAALRRSPLPVIRENSCSEVGFAGRARAAPDSELVEVVRFLRQAKRRYKLLKNFRR